MTKMFAVTAAYHPALEEGWESSGVQLPTFYMHPNAQGILSADGAAHIAHRLFAPLLERAGGNVTLSAVEVEV